MEAEREAQKQREQEEEAAYETNMVLRLQWGMIGEDARLTCRENVQLLHLEKQNMLEKEGI